MRAAVLLLLFLSGCVGGAAQADRTVATIVEGVSALDPIVRNAYARELAACPDAACEERIERAYEPARKILLSIREAWCAIAPTAPTCGGQ